MVQWIGILASYLSVGLVLVFVGPAARLRRQEQEQEKIEWQIYDQARWRRTAFSWAIAVAIMVFWPVLVVSAARIEAAASKTHFGARDPHPAEPSPALDRLVSEAQSRYSRALPFEDYQEFSSKLPWSDREHFDSRLAELGYLLTGFATGPEGEGLAVAVGVLQIGMPFALTRLLGRAGTLPATLPGDRPEFRLPPEPGDEVWEFSSSPDSWERLAGRAGLALVREGTVIEAYVTAIS
jgi:hypothetical protein